MTTKLKNFDNYQNFDWDLTKTFFFVAKLGSFTAASKVLGVIQSTLTRQVQSLERQMGFPLLVRHMTVGVTPTRKGEQLLIILERIFRDMKEFMTDIDAITNEPKNRKIKMTATHALVSYIFGDFLLDYAQEKPHSLFELVANDHLMDIVLHDMDIAIHPLDPRLKGKKMEGLQADYLFSLEKRLYASTNYINTYGEPRTVDELINHRIVAFPQSEAHPNRDINWILTLGMPKGKLHNPVHTSNSIENLIEAAEKGIGIVGSYEEFKIM